MAQSDDRSDAFLLKEYDALRLEMRDRLCESWKLEKFALGGAAAISVWLFTHFKEVPRVAWWVPFAFLLICSTRFVAIQLHLATRAGMYISRVEAHFLGNNGGWETFFRPLPLNETIAISVVWIAALLSAFALPFLVPLVHPI
ncbi:hypothetical protein [Paraburkholderia flagellata]|uniref:hypothetical protein n=1 Tax=Paraburkholderia flagellata TaxID=2883241 RepID=UPI001F3D8398|nr:hypothetical protein [Paraburkholderia flagellata]